MTLRGNTGTKKDVPGRMSVRVRLVLAAALLVAVVVGSGVWLSSQVDLGSAALTTVERSVPELVSSEVEAPVVGIDDELEVEVEEPALDAPVQDEPVQDEPIIVTVEAQQGYSATEVKADPVPAQPQSQTSQPQSQAQPQQQSQPQQTTPTTPTSPTTPTTPETDPTPVVEPEQPKPQTLSVNVTVDGSAAGMSGWSKTVTLESGSTVYDALCAADGNINARSTGYGIYVVGIDGLAEKDHGSKSGWMYAVNGIYPNTACSNYVLKSGDSVAWVYVNVDY